MDSGMELIDLGLVAAAQGVREGLVDSEELVGACLERIAAREPEIAAWAHLDAGHALAQARAADGARREGRPLGPLHGVPVGVKDIIDTQDFPTENGTVLHSGRRPGRDATVVARLREAGAVLIGKTVTTELAVFSPGATRNPRDPARTPGGSSSGSAAAVADRMVPGALGTQTNGSVIRPASFCGVVGYKPTFGAIPRPGVLPLSRWLDHVGVFARSVEDAGQLAEILAGYDPRDPDTRARARSPLLAVAREEPPVEPRLGFVRTPQWERADADTREGFSELVEALGERVIEVPLPEPFNDALEWHRTVLEADLAMSFASEYERGGDRLSAILRSMIERGREVRALDYNRALSAIPLLNAVLSELFEMCDALITPAAAGEAPTGLDSTGDPAFCTTWTFCGTPAVTLPLLSGANGLPIGVQLVGPRDDDARLLRTARWLATSLAGATHEDAHA